MEYRNEKTDTVEVYSESGQCVLRRRCTPSDATLPDVSDFHVARLTEEIAAQRYAVEIRGIDTPYGPIATDRQSQAMIATTLSYVTLVPRESISWKRQDGTFITLTMEEFKDLAHLVGEHVETCFRQEAAAVEALLSADDVTDVDISTFFNT